MQARLAIEAVGVDVHEAETPGTMIVVMEEPYREVAPPHAIAAYVDRFWSRAGASTGEHRVLPDGCIDLLVDLDADVAELVGPMSRAALVPAVTSRIVAIRFRPGAGARFADRPLDALVDQSVLASELGIETRPLIDALRAARSESERHAALVGFVRARLRDADPLDRMVRRAVDRLTRTSLPIAALADELGVSRQYLTRTFAREVGTSPKLLARIARMQRLMLAIESGRRDWAQLAHELGFADQSHLVHETTELAGLSPARLASEVSISPIASIYAHVEPTP